VRRARHAGHVSWTVRRTVAVLIFAMGFATLPSTSDSATTALTTTGWPMLIAPTRPVGIFYMLVSEPCGQTRCLRLYRTRDDDSSTRVSPLRYVPVTLPPYGRLARTPQGTVLAMVFATPKIGYILEGSSEARQLYVTRNGAHSWTKSPIPHGDSIWGLTATSTHLYALFLHCSYPQSCTNLELMHAPLRATQWRGVKIPFGNFAEETLGQVAGHGEMEMFAERIKDGEKIYVSHNGGRNFVSSTHPNLKGSRGCTLLAEDVQRVWAICTSTTHESFHFSDDSGSSWSVFVRQPHNAKATGLFSLAGSNDFAYVYTGGATGNIVRMNIGANREHVVGTIGCHSVASMTFVNASDGYVICNLVNGATTLLRSKSGGESWRRVAVPR
jgi:hypothetical protein